MKHLFAKFHLSKPKLNKIDNRIVELVEWSEIVLIGFQVFFFQIKSLKTAILIFFIILEGKLSRAMLAQQPVSGQGCLFQEF
jgi:hypothetical protein